MKKFFMKFGSLLIILPLLICSCENSTKNKIPKTTDKNSIIAVKNAVLIDGTGAGPKNNMTVIIEGERIKSIYVDNQSKIPPGAQIIDLDGAFLMPGFINAHVHNAYDEDNLKEWLKGGVTTVRDLNPHGVSDYIKSRDTLNKNIKNATIVSASPMLSPVNGYGRGEHVTSAQDAAAKVDANISRGADLIKFALEDDLPPGNNWPLLSNDEVKAIVETAHKSGKKVSVHISHARNLQPAIDAGVDDIAHMVVEPMEQKQIDEMIKKNIYFVPTLELWNGVNWLNGPMKNLYAFYKAGGKLALGTDFAGYTTHFDSGFPITEVTLMKKAGMSNMDIIVAGTKNAAHVCDLENEIGTIEVGKLANLLAVNGNPMEDITALSKTKLVIHQGQVID